MCWKHHQALTSQRVTMSDTVETVAYLDMNQNSNDYLIIMVKDEGSDRNHNLSSRYWRLVANYWIFLNRWMSTAQDNITYRMGLDASGSHATQTALILNHTDRVTYRDLSKKV
ncbi:unnamed protein product, partial [Brugia pahangi]|uniref:DUF1793 domain-containing protein n=1 Tax=Brugia pahangi TaxID=6280 RepID=A0A0N4TE45_BRUPA